MPANIEQQFTISDYHFEVMVNPANVAALMQHDVFYRQGDSDLQFVRSFYFDDIASDNIRTFCERFATDTQYHVASLARTTDWAQRNDLFLRNCVNPYYQPNPFLEQCGSLVRAYYFMAEHSAEITNNPEYQRIQQLDCTVQPHPHMPDPYIADIIIKLNQREDVKTLASCQGVADIFRYQGYEIMTVSPHARFAYIWFESISPDFVAHFQAYNISYTDHIYPTLQSTGDNAAFLETVRVCLA